MLPVNKQAERVIAKFGNPYSLSRALKLLPDKSSHRNAQAIYKWTWPKSRKGTDGFIPNSAMKAVMEAARMDGVLLTKDDLYGN